MPGMSGKELSQHLRVIKPDLKLLFMSGYTDDVGIGAGESFQRLPPKTLYARGLGQDRPGPPG